MGAWEKYPINQITLKDQRYPRLLKEIFDPPEKLYYKGRLPQGSYTSLAVVGSRKYSSYGRQVCQELVGRLVKYDIKIVSGLALGIDSIGHQVALEAGGETWAVLARGLDQVYPASHFNLACQILESGGVIFSEETEGTPSTPERFPKRNRIIAGLSQAVLVIEAAQRSGSLITAHCALEQGRSVLAVPQNIYNIGGKGTNQLISQGARLVQGLEDVLDELGIELSKNQTVKSDLSPAEQKIIQALKDSPLDIDKLSQKVKIGVVELNVILSMLVIKGEVKRMSNGEYIRQ